MSELCDTLQSGLGQLYTCSELGRYVRIRTPFLYPDGGVIDVFRLQTPDGVSLTDLGESLRWLALRFVSLFDDTLDVCSPEDFRLLEDFSEVVCWTKTDDLLEKLAA